MGIDIQKADFWKRISAWMFDFVLLITIITIVAVPLASILKYDEKLDVVKSVEKEYEDEMKANGLNPDITEEEFDALTEGERKKYHDVDERRAKDERLTIGYTVVTSVMITILVISIVVAFVLAEFIVPLIFKNGQTLGKKIFGLAVTHTNGVKLGGQAHLIRSIIGKCIIETLVPVFFAWMVVLGNLGIVGIILIILLLLLQIFVVAYTKTRSGIHDLIADAVVVDIKSQMIFESYEKLVEYKRKLHEEAIAKANY